MWMLDDGPLGDLARHVSPDPEWPRGTFHLAESVAAAAERDLSGRRQQWVWNSPALVVHRLLPGQEGYLMLFEHLRPRFANSNQHFGEHESIALCAQERNLVFVARDKGAAMLALAELGSR